jgi:hypothetical protein
MTARGLYEAHREAYLEMLGEELTPWEELEPYERLSWEHMVVEQYERDIEGEHEALAVLDNLEF